MMMPHSRSLKSRVQKLQSSSMAEQQHLFSEFLNFPSASIGGRRRLFCSMQTFWMFLHQVLSGNISCQETLQRTLAWLALENGKTASPNTAAYCKARGRLDFSWLQKIGTQTVKKIEAFSAGAECWHGHPVKVVDGSGLSMPDTPANQKTWPQTKTQKPGCGFPTMRIVALFSLASGVLLSLKQDHMKVDERTLFRRLWDALTAGDVLLADRGFTSFADFFLLKQREVDCVMRNHQRRSVGVRLHKKLGRHDKLVAWKKTGICPKWMRQKDWQNLPKEMVVRQFELQLENAGFRTQKIVIVTTLLDAKKYPTAAFAQLYRRRWLAEIFLRDIKISMNMDVLKCKTPAMIKKELEMYLLAYNLIRALIFKAAKTHAVEPTRISFKRTTDTLRQWTPVLLANKKDSQKQKALTEILLHYIAQLIIPNRPDRNEPRALKRRPKNYQLLNKPRHQFKEIKHRNKYVKGLS